MLCNSLVVATKAILTQGAPLVGRPDPASARIPCAVDSRLVSEAVRVENLRRAFGSTVAVADATWTARSGEITCVLGPNGAGKTTSVECLEGLQRPDAGSVRVLGSDPWGADARHRARVGVMLQDGGLPQSATPLRLLRHLAAFAGGATRTDELVDTLGIAGFGRTSIRRLSGGQRQRVALAAALLHRPEVAFLDEPSAGLDPHARRDVWRLVAEVAADGAAVVLTTHSFEEAERLADRIVILHRGQVVADGTTSELTEGPGLESRYFALTEDAS